MTQAKQYRRLGKFELHELIGEGAMGVVWKAYDSVLRRYVALKLLPAKVSRTGDIRERFLREARAAGVLQHSNIVTIYDLGEAENQLFIAMELVDGRDLSTIISGHDPLPLERKLDIVIEVLAALTYAHNRGVIHRDVKPSNVRIATDGGIKIMDFGIARLQSAEFTGSGAIVGTPSYMAPEQITNGPIGPATDLFAVGCLLYELLGYHKPFEAETIHGVLYQVLTTDPPALRTMAQRGWVRRQHLVQHAVDRLGLERLVVAQQLVQQAAHGKEVGGRADRRVRDLLGRHVARRPHDGAGTGELRRLQPRDPEVHDLDAAVRGDAHVRRFDVAVDHAAVVGVRQRREHLDHDIELALERQRVVPTDDRAQVAAVHQLHRDEELVLGFAEVVDRDDVGVLQHAGGARLAQEALTDVGGAAHLGGEELEGDVAPQDGVVGLPHDAHGALADELVQLELAESPVLLGLGHPTAVCTGRA